MPFSDAVRETFIKALTGAIGASTISAAQAADRAGMPASTLRSQLTGASREVPDPPQVFALEVALDLRPGTLSQHLGYLPAGPASVPVKGVLDAIASDELLDDAFRDVLGDMYRSMVKRSDRSDRTSSSSKSGSKAAAAANRPARTR